MYKTQVKYTNPDRLRTVLMFTITNQDGEREKYAFD
jgi:hypothetical protein